MIILHPPMRIATSADSAELADLVNIAGEGLPLYVWKGLASDGQDPWEVGRTRQAEKAREDKIIAVDYGQGAVASLTGYVIGATQTEIGEDFPALFRPLQELENQALNSWYVNVLACYPEYRGKGLGGKLLDVAEEIGRSEGVQWMSVIVADSNAGALRLYKRHGYKEAARAPCIKEDWPTNAESWILLLKPL